MVTASLIFLIASFLCLFRSAYVEREVNQLREEAKANEKKIHDLYQRADDQYNARTLALEERDWAKDALNRLTNAHNKWKDAAIKLATYHLWVSEDWRADKLEPMTTKEIDEIAREVIGSPIVVRATPVTKVG